MSLSFVTNTRNKTPLIGPKAKALPTDGGTDGGTDEGMDGATEGGRDGGTDRRTTLLVNRVASS